MRYIVSCLICLFLLLFCGCSSAQSQSFEDLTFPSQTQTTEEIIYTEPEPSIESTPPETQIEIPESTEIVEEETVVSEPTEPAHEPLDTAPGSYQLQYTDDTTGDYLDYYAFIPNGATQSMPLVIFLHGDGEVGNIDILEDFGLISQARAIYGNSFPFIAISPCTRTYSWIDGTIPSTLKGLIDHVVDTYHIDPEHIIIAGHSRGAIGVWHMISLYGDFFSAAIPVSCGAQGYMDFENCAEVPVSAYVGTDSPNEERYATEIGNIIISMEKYGGFATLTVISGATHGQTSTAAFTAQTFNWMLEQ